MPWHAMAGRRSSTPTRVRSSPAQLLPACSPARASPSAWTATGPGGIMCSSNGCGAASNTRRYICEPTKPSARRATRSADISTFIIAVAPIRVLTAARRIKPTSPRWRSVRQPNPGRRSTYRRGDSVQTTGTSSVRGDRGRYFVRTRGWGSVLSWVEPNFRLTLCNVEIAYRSGRILDYSFEGDFHELDQARRCLVQWRG